MTTTTLGPSVKLSPELAKLRVPPIRAERDALKSSIQQHGVLVPLLVAETENGNFLVDGHTRDEICREVGIIPLMSKRKLKEESLREVFVQLQLGRRNLPEVGQAFLRGSIYIERKRQGRRTTSRQGGEKSLAEELGVLFGASPRTIERDGKLARAMGEIEAVLGEAARVALCSGEIQASRRDIEDLSTMGDKAMNAGFDRLRAGEPLGPKSSGMQGGAGDRQRPASSEDELADTADTGDADMEDTNTSPALAAGAQTRASRRAVAAIHEKVQREMPTIFDDVPDLETAATALGTAVEKLGGLVNGWTSGPGPDVDGVLERLRDAVQLASEAHSIVDAELIPRDVCEPCDGDHCESCAGFGWFSKANLESAQA